jgi:hypothetical protein
MTLIDNPNQQSLFTLAPAPAPPKPERKRWRPWHYVVVILGAPVLLWLLGLGAYTQAQWLKGSTVAQASTTASHEASHSPTPHASQPAPPRYNLPGYQSAVSGPVERAFAGALWAVRADIRKPDYQAAVTDAPRLMAAASSWLSLLRQTNPPPSWGPQKLTYEQAATLARKAGQTTQQALSSGDLAGLQRGADQAKRAQWLLSHATAQGPHGS